MVLMTQTKSDVLKTLKDLTYNTIAKDGIHIFIAKQARLKQEAIKWIKEFRRISERKEYDITIDKFLGYSIEPMITWIKHFFNITEEDLK